jgi:hypothetical protein
MAPAPAAVAIIHSRRVGFASSVISVSCVLLNSMISVR